MKTKTSGKLVAKDETPKKVWVATVVDSGDSCDGKARTLGVFFAKEKAKKLVEKDIGSYVKYAEKGGLELEVSYGRMTAHTSDYRHGCEWNIEEVEVK